MKAGRGVTEILPGEGRWGAQGIPASSGKKIMNMQFPLAAPHIFPCFGPFLTLPHLWRLQNRRWGHDPALSGMDQPVTDSSI